MYFLSKNKKLCYFLAKQLSLEGTYNQVLVNKTEAVQICNSYSNGTVPHGEFLFNKECQGQAFTWVIQGFGCNR